MKEFNSINFFALVNLPIGRQTRRVFHVYASLLPSSAQIESERVARKFSLPRKFSQLKIQSHKDLRGWHLLLHLKGIKRVNFLRGN
jgi:hypothetical protein